MTTTPTAKVTPRDFVLWVFSMGALVVSIISFITLAFEYINRLVGDAPIYDLYSTGLRMAMATLIIVFPLYLWSTRFLNQDIRAIPEKKELWVRKWLIYIGLFVAVVVIIIDLIVLINTYLGGEEITAAFLLKVLTVLLVVGAAFTYYLRALAGVWERNERLSRMLGYGAAAVVVVMVVSGFFIMGSPREMRLMREDQTRISHLQDIQWRVTNSYQQKGALPETLDVLADPLSGFVVPTDPVTNGSYEYRVVDATSLTFELCANFARASNARGEESSVARPSYPYYSGDMYGETYWKHDAGRTCFERTIDPDQYPLYDKTSPASIKPGIPM